MKIFNLIRWKNLVMIAYVFFVIKIYLLNALNIPSFLNYFDFSILTLSVVFISAAGYIINDINDVEIDKINKSRKIVIGRYISEEKAFNLYFILNIIGISLGAYIAYKIDHINFAFIHIASSILLYQYALNLKKKLIISNILIAFLSSLSIIVIIIFDLLPSISKENLDLIKQISIFILAYAIFAFLISFIRELVKDIEDYEGDKIFGVESIPIVFGEKTASYIASSLSMIIALVLAIYSYNYLNNQIFSISYVIVFVVIPLLYTSIMLLRISEKRDYEKISKILKFIMFTGISSIIVFTLSLKYGNGI